MADSKTKSKTNALEILKSREEERNAAEKAARDNCSSLAKAWDAVGMVLAVILLIMGIVSAMSVERFSVFVIYAIAAVLIYLMAATVSAILKYISVKK